MAGDAGCGIRCVSLVPASRPTGRISGRKNPALAIAASNLGDPVKP